MWTAVVLAASVAAQFGGGQPGGGGGGPPSAPTPQRHAAPTSPELQRVERLRARFDFARDSNNTATLEALDGELRQLLGVAVDAKAVKGPVEIPDAGNPPDPEVVRVVMQRRLLGVAGVYDAAALKVRAELITQVLLQERRKVEDGSMDRGEPAPAEVESWRRQRRR